MISIIDPSTHTMSLGSLKDDLKSSTKNASMVFWFDSKKMQWDIYKEFHESKHHIYDDIEKLISDLLKVIDPNKHQLLVIMSNGHFHELSKKLPQALNKKLIPSP